MSQSAIQRGLAKERILDAVSDLFYRQGYNATGIQQIIDEAGVSKGTFYTHFKSKEELGLAYLNRRNHEEITELQEILAEINDPHRKYIEFNIIMRERMKSSGYRGCAFANMSAEVPDGNSPIRKLAKFHYEGLRAIIRDIVKDLIRSDPKYKGLDPQFVTDQYMTVQIGALLNAAIYQDTWPYDHAEKSIRRLIGEDA